MKFTGKEILGMIHMAPPSSIEKALEEIAIYERQGLYGVIIENYHGSTNDVVYLLRKLPKTSLKIGINILPNEIEEAFSIANEFHIDFIQFDHVGGKYKGVKRFDRDVYNELRSESNVYILGGVWPKYYQPVNHSILTYDIEAGEKCADAIVVTGEGTGKETSLDKIKEFRRLISDNSKLIIGAGLTPLNVVEQMKYVDGAIVGSAFKPLGNTMKMVDEDLVKHFMTELLG